jgi:hypothetical protein
MSRVTQRNRSLTLQYSQLLSGVPPNFLKTALSTTKQPIELSIGKAHKAIDIEGTESEGVVQEKVINFW